MRLRIVRWIDSVRDDPQFYVQLRRRAGEKTDELRVTDTPFFLEHGKLGLDFIKARGRRECLAFIVCKFCPFKEPQQPISPTSERGGIPLL